MKYGFIREYKGSDSIIEQAKKLEDYGVKVVGDSIICLPSIIFPTSHLLPSMNTFT